MAAAIPRAMHGSMLCCFWAWQGGPPVCFLLGAKNVWPDKPQVCISLTSMTLARFPGTWIFWNLQIPAQKTYRILKSGSSPIPSNSLWLSLSACVPKASRHWCSLVHFFSRLQQEETHGKSWRQLSLLGVQDCEKQKYSTWGQQGITASGMNSSSSLRSISPSVGTPVAPLVSGRLCVLVVAESWAVAFFWTEKTRNRQPRPTLDVANLPTLDVVWLCPAHLQTGIHPGSLSDQPSSREFNTRSVCPVQSK